MKYITWAFLSLIFFYGCKEKIERGPYPEYTFQYDKWEQYLGGPDRNHFSILDEITPGNVSDLEVIWTYETPESGQMQVNPIVVDSVLYGVSPGLSVFALNATNGRQIWLNRDTLNDWHNASRGVAYWKGEEGARVFITRGSNLIAVDASNGEVITSFGDGGKVDLKRGLPEYAQNRFVGSTTPGTIFENLIIMPIRVGEGWGAAPGDIRAYDVLTGETVWTFHTIPLPRTYGNDTWSIKRANEDESVGGANNWAGMALDPGAGILYVPTGSAAPDFYGGQRLGNNLFANCLLALDVRTGKRIWHFQMVHHDIWDRDPPAPPNLLYVEREGQKIPAVAQITKQGYVFVFNRYTGEPLFDIEEFPVPKSDLIGEQASPTQPVPVLPKPFARQVEELTEKDISPYAPNQEELQEQFHSFIKGTYRPPDTDPALLLPGYDGGGEWGGAAADPEKGILYVNSNEMAWELRVDPTIMATQISPGASLYEEYCGTCHKANREGAPLSGFPSLLGIKERLEREDLINVIVNGKGMMPAFGILTKQEVNLISDYLFEIDKEVVEGQGESPKLPYRHAGYNKWLDANGLPAIDPPWGQLHAIDLNSGDYKWSIPLGHAPELQDQEINDTGIESYGGPAITANGLLFIAGTKDGYFRVFHRDTGELLWEYELPAPAFMTPSIYEQDGKQFVVVVCGGEKLGTPKGNKVLAFGLRDE